MWKRNSTVLNYTLLPYLNITDTQLAFHTGHKQFLVRFRSVWQAVIGHALGPSARQVTVRLLHRPHASHHFLPSEESFSTHLGQLYDLLSRTMEDVKPHTRTILEISFLSFCPTGISNVCICPRTNTVSGLGIAGEHRPFLQESEGMTISVASPYPYSRSQWRRWSYQALVAQSVYSSFAAEVDRTLLSSR